MKQGTRTALVVPVPEARWLVPDPVVPLLDPFVERGEVDDALLEQLAEFCAVLVPFPLVLGSPPSLPAGQRYLTAQPRSTFRHLSHDLRRLFPQVVGPTEALEAFVPHLVVPEGVSLVRRLDAVARSCELREPGGGVVATFPFGTAVA